MKKIIAFILCSVIAVSLFAGCSGKDKPSEGSGEKYKPEDIVTQDGFSYVIGEDGNATIVKYEVHDMQEKLEIPDKLGGAPVTVIGKEAFAGNKKISEVKFPAMLETIEDGAFKESDIHIALMVYSSRLKTIGADAFSFCTNLVQIDVPKSVESYGERCFGNCPKLRVVTIRGDVSLSASIFENSTKTFVLWTNKANAKTVKFAKDNGYEVKTGDNL